MPPPPDQPQPLRSDAAAALADAFLAGAWTRPGMIQRGHDALGVEAVPGLRWLRREVDRVLAAYAHPPRDRPRELAAFVAATIDARRAAPFPPKHRLVAPGAMAGRRPWPAIPELDTAGDLADWLALSHGELAWFADVQSRERRADDRRLRHYTYAWSARPGAPVRFLEQPKARLKAIQRRILHKLLVHVPAHDAAYGFVPGRDVLQHARRHAGAAAVLRFDVRDFFVSLPAGRVYGIFRLAGYPEAVAHALTGLTTNAVPPGAWADVPAPADPALHRQHVLLGRRLAAPHLPQGAPTSPLLANLCAFTLDRRMAALAVKLGATYTRYADDLVLSGDRALARHAQRTTQTVRAIVRGQGLRLNETKTTIMVAAQRQRVTGIVVNDHPNIARDEYDRLRAILHNAARAADPHAENRAHVPDFRAHLRGRIAWVEHVNPQRGAKLRARFEQIAWPASPR
ncbi:reverse transcriptase family protein [Conexibacter woesei]|uniref:reverse transcriptase family protein n=1 Tax=Conexibacter woesei TaxID=191495 RepID=UPI00042617FD|nr:reverse transcriptase family protein [Conexibacter woesei]